MAAEILKQQIASWRPRGLYYFRDQKGLEADFIVPAMTKSRERLAEAKSGYTINKVLVHREGKGLFPATALKGGVQAMPVSCLGAVLGGMNKKH